MGRPKILGLICPQCKRDFSKEHNGSSVYARHVTRKNPCGSTEPYSRAPRSFKPVNRNNFDELDLSHVIGPVTDAPPSSWIRNLLHQVFEKEENRCIVVKNLENPDEIYVKRQGKVAVMNLRNLTILTLLMLHERLFHYLHLSGWEKYSEFKEWVMVYAGVHLDDHNWTGTIEPLSYYYIAVRDFLKNYLEKMKHRRHETWMISCSTFMG
jgi:hypothetical protein